MAGRRAPLGSRTFSGACHGFYMQAVAPEDGGAAHHGPILIEDSLLEEVNGYGVQTYYGNVTCAIRW